MKKCPKCGTILDDSKKKCYMCGADLLRSSITNFGDSFNEQIGATMTTSQDNVFNNVNNISAKLDDVINNNDNVTFSNNTSSVDLFKSEMDGLNSMQYDERSPLEKIFSGESKFKRKDEFDAKEAMKNNLQNPITQNNDNLSTELFSQHNKNKENIFTKKNNITFEEATSEKKNEKPQINWGNNLTDNSNNNFWDFKNKANKKTKINFNFIVNIICLILFLIGMGYVYFNFIKPKSGGHLSFGGLNYKIDSSFELKTDNSNNRYYVKGNNCAIRINYGAANNTDGFIESYFDGIRATYENQKGYSTTTEKIQLNGNVWSELSVIEIKADNTDSEGFKTSTKYKHTSIVYNANFYDIVFTNTEDDSECASLYKSFVSSLEFD